MSKMANPLLNGEMDFNGKSTANTKTKGHRPTPLGQKLVQNGKFSRSSKRNPCPICTRDKDDKCAFIPNEVVHCFNGSSFYPPQHLKLGNTVLANGINWALVAIGGGFSGNHHIFKPDKGKTYEKRQKFEKISINKIIRLFNILSEETDQALKPDPQILNLRELNDLGVKIADCLESSKILLKYLKQYSIREILEQPQLDSTNETTKSYFHKLRNRQEQIRQFRHECLGENYGD